MPNGGTLDGEQVKDVKVIFDPDRQTSFFSDKILVKFNGKVRKLLRNFQNFIFIIYSIIVVVLHLEIK